MDLQLWIQQHSTLHNDVLGIMGKAVKYMLKRWEALTFFVDNPQVPLDNNAAERSLRGPVVGRKNHYGSKSRRGTEVAAVFYTLLETAKLCGIQPTHYLTTVAERALREPGTVTLPSEFITQQAPPT
jgi:transposase